MLTYIMPKTPVTTETLLHYLERHAEGLCQWCPREIMRRQYLEATPRRIAWARRVLARGAYPSRELASRIGGPSPVGGAELSASIASVLDQR